MNMVEDKRKQYVAPAFDRLGTGVEEPILTVSIEDWSENGDTLDFK